ncbi:MAG: phospho-N-acetylmuramoyl-pentapeptide-transferase [Lachnospiraceae bacterium]|nr:phospho-N-acetylmuramoyl-pentapeptide-transferase [Lachnospiraceae bacterium]
MNYIYPVISAAVSFAIVALLMPVLIRRLKKRNASNTERDIMESHVKKQGTPTMGGILIFLGVVVGSLPFSYTDARIGAVLLLAGGFGLVGFLDDYLKVVKRKSDGLIAWQKFGLQFLFTCQFAWYLINVAGVSADIIIPFMGTTISFGWFNLVILYFAVLGTVNGVNFTDGVDGLCSSVTIVVSTFFLVVSVLHQSGVAVVPAAMIGALCGFLIYNHHPAKIFMGDTGSLFLGGFVAGMAYAFQMPIFIILIGIIYLVEVLSVIIQVGSFKLRHGKRVFKMAPIHHHFELSGWSERKVVAVFSIVTLIGCIIAYLGM